jgi:23S rRNA (guanosine2251-2'-O)-methyltransferase
VTRWSPRRPEPRRAADAAAADDLIEGRNPVAEALRAGRPLRKILMAAGARTHGVLSEILDSARAQGIVVQAVDPRRLDAISRTRAHQGVVAFASQRPLLTIEALISAARAKGPPFLVLLDGIEDPQNLGAILRTAEAAGAHGAVIPKHRAAGLSPAAERASAGALAFLPVAQVTNMTRAVDTCREAGLYTVAAHADAATEYDAHRLSPPIAIVVGSEGRGVSRLVREHCDLLVRIPMRGRIGSLNASVAAALLLFEVVRQTKPGT